MNRVVDFMKKLTAAAIGIAGLGLAVTSYELDLYGLKSKYPFGCTKDSLEKKCVMETHGPIWRLSYEVCEYKLNTSNFSSVIHKGEREKFLTICADDCKKYPDHLFKCAEADLKVRMQQLEDQQEIRSLKDMLNEQKD